MVRLHSKILLGVKITGALSLTVGIVFALSNPDFNVRFYTCIGLVMLLYVVCMSLSDYGMDKLIYLVDRHPRAPLYTLLTCLPLYFCELVVGMIPLFSYEVWFMTNLPVLILMAMPLTSVAEVWRDLKFRQVYFWLFQIAVHALIILTTQLFMRQFM